MSILGPGESARIAGANTRLEKEKTMKKLFPVLAMVLLAAIVLLAGCAREEEAAAEPEELVWIWYPNESTPEFADSRAAIIEVAAETLGRPITEQLTTDYAIAIEALVNENAAFSWFGGEGYTQAHEREPAILPLVVNTDDTGSLDNAKYYSMLGTLAENERDRKSVV